MQAFTAQVTMNGVTKPCSIDAVETWYAIWNLPEMENALTAIRMITDV
ncbi:hypothetical protein FGIG_11650 [Fasciola gigantica]|uniref:Uncharacterized protein n=1 Tax=Fasciola gigantica TaxID=46835 RepID=A0A504ZE02_FASGI|nr:hypothetical protein FGIG_11650 [Fasciola gigantica]